MAGTFIIQLRVWSCCFSRRMRKYGRCSATQDGYDTVCGILGEGLTRRKSESDPKGKTFVGPTNPTIVAFQFPIPAVRVFRENCLGVKAWAIRLRSLDGNKTQSRGMPDSFRVPRDSITKLKSPITNSLNAPLFPRRNNFTSLFRNNETNDRFYHNTARKFDSSLIVRYFDEGHSRWIYPLRCIPLKYSTPLKLQWCSCSRVINAEILWQLFVWKRGISDGRRESKRTVLRSIWNAQTNRWSFRTPLAE